MEDYGLPFFFDGAMPNFSAADPGNFQAPLPEQIAQHLALQGVKPADFMANPQAFQQQQAPVPFPPMNPSASAHTSIEYGGNQPTNGGVPMAPQMPPQSTEAPTTTEASAKGQPGGDTAKRITDSLKGLQAAAAPQAQRVYTPSPVNPNQHSGGNIKGGQLAALLAMMQAKGSAPQVPLPLGAILAGRM